MSELRRRGGPGGGRSHQGETPLPVDSDQAVALPRRRLRDPLVAGADPVEFARRRLRPGARLRAARRCSAPTWRSTSIVIDETNTRVNIPKLLRRFRGNGFRHARARRRAVEPVSARARHRAAVPRGRHPGGAWAVSMSPAASRCSTARPIDLDARARDGHLDVRRRGRRTGSTPCCRTPRAAACSRSTIT